MSKTYGLYQTFSLNNPSNDLSILEKKQLKENLLKLDLDQKKAVFFLIIEHAKITDNFSFDPSKTLILPYDISHNEASEDAEENIEFDLEKLPIKLKWILWKFNLMIYNQNEKNEF